MSLREFDIIQRFFQRPSHRRDVTLGIGDDCALVAPPAECDLAITLDTLVADIHFLADTDPYNLGHKTLAVNLSDLAAVGAQAAWITLSLTLPHLDEAWLAALAAGLFDLAQRYDVELIGGDTTRGPLALGVQACGFVPKGQGLTRRGARSGDIIYVTGTLGDAGCALQQLLAARQGASAAEAAATPHHAALRQRLERPEPRLAEGVSLRQLATAAIDISDGLGQDLGHILQASGVGASLQVDRLPLSAALRHCASRPEAIAFALSGGDDYELCFTVAPEREAALQQVAAQWRSPCTAIGVIEAAPGLRLREGPAPYRGTLPAGYQHFS